MKSWNFNVKSSPKEISEKLESALNSSNGFAFKTESDENNSDETLRARPVLGLALLKGFVPDGENEWDDGEVPDKAWIIKEIEYA